MQIQVKSFRFTSNIRTDRNAVSLLVPDRLVSVFQTDTHTHTHVSRSGAES